MPPKLVIQKNGQSVQYGGKCNPPRTIHLSPVSAEIDVIAMPGDGVDLLGEDGVEDAPQEDVEVAQQEEEHGYGLGGLRGICERMGAPFNGGTGGLKGVILQ